MRNKFGKFSIISVLLALLATICIICFLHNTYAVNNAYASVDAQSTSDLGFIYNSETEEYKVKALNKSLGEANIPAYYNGHPVTAIEDNGFMGCANLEQVIIPPTVKSIGKNAFLRCTNLQNVRGMLNVVSYGDNAFAFCPKIDYVIMPNGIENLGASIFNSVEGTIYSRTLENEMTNINSTWISNFSGKVVYGNDLVYEKYTNSNNEKGVKIAPWQNLTNLGVDDNTTFVIESWHDDVNSELTGKLLYIDEYAFYGMAAKEVVLKHPDNTNYNHSIKIGAYAFSYAYVKNFNFVANIEIDDSCEAIFYGSEAVNIIFPDSLTMIPNMTFSDCNSLESLLFANSGKGVNSLSEKIVKIGNSAFSTCLKLPNLYVPSSVEYVGQSAFGFWGTNIKQNVYIDKFEEESANWNPSWNNDISEQCEIEFTAAATFEINFIVECSDVINPIGNEKVTVSRNSTIADINKKSIKSESHDFSGVWYTTSNREEGTEFPLNKPIKQNLTLYAGWDIKHFDIEFKSNRYYKIRDAVDGEPISGTTKNFEYGTNYQFYIIMNKGYESLNIFYGNEKLNPQNESTNLFSFVIKKNGAIDGTAEAIKYQIDYFYDGGINPDSNPSYYTVESPTIYLDAPYWAVYNSGVWTDNGMIEAGSTGYKVFYAQWSDPVEYKITYTNLRNGKNPSSNPSTYTYESGTIVLAKPEWIAYETCVWDIPVIHTGSSGDITIKAVWSNPTQFKIEYVLSGNAKRNPNNPTTYTVESPRIELEDPLGTHTDTGYRYYWKTYVIESGSYGDKKIICASALIKYFIHPDVFSCGSPDSQQQPMGGPFISAVYNSEYTIEKLRYKDDSNYYLAYYVNESDDLFAPRPTDDQYTLLSNANSVKVKNLTTVHGASVNIKVVYRKSSSCVTEGTLITLSDGSQKAVQNLDGSERLLVWNLYTGTFDVAPILFIDSDPERIYEVINLYFSDGTNVKVISEHAFWDFNLNKYVFLRNDAEKYIGHWFNKQGSGEFSWEKVQLIDVKITKEVTTAWSPVTYGHLCYYVNGMLSMPGATEGLINIFEVDSETLKIDETLMQADIEQYGLFTYEEFAEIYPITEEIFEAFNGQYLKISVGKGLITMEEIGELINHYADFLS